VALESVYIETTIVSLLAAEPSRSLITAANQQATRDWWHLRRAGFVCVVSAEVIVEASHGDVEQARRRLEILRPLPRLDVTPEARELARAFLATGALPAKAVRDAAHLAVAAVADVDYLLTWNCRHLANAQILRRLEHEAKTRHWELPRVCTPVELMGDSIDETGSDS
jgi:hypothetical protein